MTNLMKSLARWSATVAVAAVAVVLALALWHHYMASPWTRDGRVRAEVVDIAPEIPGTVNAVAVVDNQFVHKGDLLFTLDPARYRLALRQAQAALDSRSRNSHVAEAKAHRRAAMSDLASSAEEKEQYSGMAGIAAASVSEAVAEVDLARLNLARTEIRSPVNGYVTNLRLRAGAYAAAGQPAVAVVDADSFWVAGYFEETKLAGVHPGDPVRIDLMGGPSPLAGHVESLSHGITDLNGDPAGNGLANVNPVFTWVRLAQRLPVRIHIDRVPAGVTLAAGMSCTVIVGNHHDLGHDLRAAIAMLRGAMSASP